MACRIDPDAIAAIDVHVHVESDGHGHFALDDELLDASAAYFRSSENRTPPSRTSPRTTGTGTIAAVVFTVDAEHAHRATPPCPASEIADEAAAHADVLIPFGSVDPHPRGRGRRRARRLVERARRPRLQVPPEPAGLRAERPPALPALGGAAGAGRAGPVPHRPDRHRRRAARRPRHQAALLRPDAARRRRRRLPRPHDHHGASLGALAGRGDLHRHAQGERLHRPVGLVAEVLPAAARPAAGSAAQAQGAVRLRLPADHPGPLAGRLRRASTSRTRCAR